jgi:hypothetical protein
MMQRYFTLSTLCLLAALAALAGCNLLGAMSGGSIKPDLNVKARYRDLDGKRVAVLVAPSRSIATMNPDAASKLARAVSTRIAADMPGTKVIDPRHVVTFQDRNPEWVASDYRSLAKHLDADRIVVIDLSTYSFRDRQNPGLWKGTVMGNVGVVEADGPRPYETSFQTVVDANFPEGKPVGKVESDQQTLELGMTKAFAVAVSRLFHDHTIEGGG